MTGQWRLVVDGLAFGEGLRWHDGTLWLADVFGREVLRVGADGLTQVVVRVPGRPSGLGWTPEGTLLAVSTTDRRLLALRGDRLEVVAELGHLVGGDCNDMIVDRFGRAYIGNLGYDYFAGDPRQSTDLLLVDGDGAARAVAEELWGPNGMALNSAGDTLYVAETSAERISVFTVDRDGSLHDRRLLDNLHGLQPDGISLDAAGQVWLASHGTGEVALLSPDGTTVERAPAPGGKAQGCLLGGTDGRTLYVSSTSIYDEQEALAQRVGRVYAREVHTPAAGRH